MLLQLAALRALLRTILSAHCESHWREILFSVFANRRFARIRTVPLVGTFQSENCRLSGALARKTQTVVKIKLDEELFTTLVLV